MKVFFLPVYVTAPQCQSLQLEVVQVIPLHIHASPTANSSRKVQLLRGNVDPPVPLFELWQTVQDPRYQVTRKERGARQRGTELKQGGATRRHSEVSTFHAARNFDAR